MLALAIEGTLTQDGYHVRASASVKTTLPTSGASTVRDIEAAREQVHARLRQVGRELDEQLDELAAKARADAAEREAAAAPAPAETSF